MAFYPTNLVSSGGSQVKQGEFNISYTSTTKVTLGFQPKYLSVVICRTAWTTSSGSAGQAYFYNEDKWGTSLQVKVTSECREYSIPTSSSNLIASIDSDGFTIAKCAYDGRAVYLAVG